MNFLRLRFEPEDEWHGELVAAVSASGFAGKGAAWFSTDELCRFSAATSAFPLRDNDLPSIAGGFGPAREAPGQVHLAIGLAPHDLRGSVRVTVRLATEVWKSETADLARDVTVRFLVTYGDLAVFGPAILDLVEGRSAEAILRSSAD